VITTSGQRSKRSVGLVANDEVATWLDWHDSEGDDLEGPSLDALPKLIPDHAQIDDYRVLALDTCEVNQFFRGCASLKTAERGSAGRPFLVIPWVLPTMSWCPK
jgi:hypothetical protein